MGDWRLSGQDRYLQGAQLTRRDYRPASESWTHDHCAFCTTRFCDADHAGEHDETAGYTTTASHAMGEDYFSDFAEAFGWTVVDG
jgi:hypothetical protein